MKPSYYHHPEAFTLEQGGVLDDLTIAYHTYGTLNDRRDNAVWVCHALTASSEVAEWWPHTVEEGKFLDPKRFFVVCANILGSHYGTTGPLSTDPATGQPYYDTFPRLTIRDMARAHLLLADALDLHGIHAGVGSSVGGFQTLEMCIERPKMFDRLILIATDAKASPWTIAIDETQRMAIRADSTYGEARADAGMAGMAAARAIGLLSYRGPEGYNETQADPEGLAPAIVRRAVTYQQHQGDKLCRRYNAYSYMRILDAFDTHDVGRGRGGIYQALQRLKQPTMVIGISSDIVFTPPEMQRLCRSLPNAQYAQIESRFGHDGFLVEHQQLNDILNPFMLQ